MPSSSLPVYDRNNIFARILRGEAPCTKVYEDEYALAFKDIHPKAQVHVLAIPKGEYVSLIDFSQSAPPDMVAGFWRAVTRVAEALDVAGGYRIGSNVGPGGGQVVFHFHVHILSGPRT
jgi:diadenosine tetraphosphate (Ap4A) HIT family hydrolase